MSAELTTYSKNAIKALENLISTVEQKTFRITVVETYEFNPDMIKQTVSQLLDIPIYKIESNLRKREVVDARFIVIYLLAKHSHKLSLSAIGKMLGNRDHSTVLNAKQVTEDLLQTNYEFRSKYELCERVVALNLKNK